MFANAHKGVKISTSFRCLQQTIRSHFCEILATHICSKYRQRVNLTYILLTILQDGHYKLPVDMCNNRCMLRGPTNSLNGLNISVSLKFFLLQQWMSFLTRTSSFIQSTEFAFLASCWMDSLFGVKVCFEICWKKCV
jgi:hypothetical protein